MDVDLNEADASVSASFPPRTDASTDLVLVSLDKVWFFVNHALLTHKFSKGLPFLSRCSTSTRYLPAHALSCTQFAMLPESSEVINIVLHTIYGKSSAHLPVSDDTFPHVLDMIVAYGVALPTHLAPGLPLFTLLLVRARDAPLFFYALAAKHDIYALAAPISALLLACSIADILGDSAPEVPPHYLLRLVALRIRRQEALKSLLARQPDRHDVSDFCSAEGQEHMIHAWALTAAHFVMERGPGEHHITPLTV